MRSFIFLVASVALAQWTPELALKVKSVTAPAPSPDGKHVVWVETRAVMETDKSEMATQIMVASSTGTGRFALTAADKNASAPAWAPDSKQVYFLSNRTGKQQLYRIAIDGGEAEALTDWKGALASYRLSPDGKLVALTATEERADDEKAKKEKRDWTVIDEHTGNAGLWVIDAEGDGPRKPKKLVGAERHIAEFAWSPDSKRIAYGHVKSPLADHWTTSDLAEVEVEGATVKTLASTNASESDPHYSPDGKHLAFVRSTDPPRWAQENRVVLMNRVSGELRVLPKTFDEQPKLIGWTGDSTRMLFAEALRTKQALYAMPVDGPPAVLYTPSTGIAAGAAVNASGTHLALTQESSSEPAEVFVMALADRKPVKVSAANAALPKFSLGETRVITWKSKDGLPVEGLLTLPASYEKGKKYPFLLNIHGGPAGAFSETFLGRYGIYPLAALSEKGYAVLRPNIRGSSGYGREFRFANYKDWGGKDYEDLMAGVDEVIKQGIADPEHMGVLGWSYGGYMTSWIVTQTKRFKAAAAGAPVTNLWSFTGTADIPGFLPDYFGGEPWAAFDNFQKHSPMNFVKGVTTPTLILHGQADLRVPITQGKEFYESLKRQGVTTKMVTYPRMPHGPVEPKFMLDIMTRNMEWMDRYVR